MTAAGLVNRISSTDTTSAVEHALADAIPLHAREVLLAHQREENAAAARRLLAVADCVATRMKTLRIIGAEPRRARALALSEIAQASSCTIHTAEVHSSIGLLLDRRLPAVRDAALAGLLDMSHLSTIHRALNEVLPEVTRQIEEDVLAAARHLAPAALAKEIERLLLSVDPASAERRREVETRRRHVRRYPRAAGMAQINAYLSADEAIAFDATLDEVASTVCPFDPRDKDVRRADAVLALAAGTGRLACGCGRDDCSAADAGTAPAMDTPNSGDAAPSPPSTPPVSDAVRAGSERSDSRPDRCLRCASESAENQAGVRYRAGDHLRASAGHREADRRGTSRTHVYLHADLATIANLADNPAFLTGYGPIGADYARMLAENAQWQLIVSEATHLADEWTKRHPSADARRAVAPPAAMPVAGSATTDDRIAGRNGGTHPDEAEDVEDIEDDPEYWDFIEFEYEKYLDRHREADRKRKAFRRRTIPNDTAPLEGMPRSSAPTPLRHIRLRGFVPLPVIGDGRLIDIIEARIAEHPALAGGVFPDGHGGYRSPPPGALRYKPRRRLMRSVRARDGHCRHPGCTVRADRCEIDHVVPFDHRRPQEGGWTVSGNLHCLCKQHHQLKTWDYWSVTVLAGYAELWSSTITGQRAISLPGGFRPRALGADLMATGIPPHNRRSPAADQSHSAQPDTPAAPPTHASVDTAESPWALPDENGDDDPAPF